MKKEGVKFKDTQLFKTIKTIAPDILDTVTDVAATVYPPLGVVNTLVDGALEVAKGKGDHEAVAKLTESSKDYNEAYKDYLADVQDARDMYEKSGGGKADEIASSVISWNLWIIMGLVGVMVATILYVDGKVAAVISGIVGTAIGNLFQERNTVIGFFFGSSQGSKDKDLK